MRQLLVAGCLVNASKLARAVILTLHNCSPPRTFGVRLGPDALAARAGPIRRDIGASFVDAKQTRGARAEPKHERRYRAPTRELDPRQKAFICA